MSFSNMRPLQRGPVPTRWPRSSAPLRPAFASQFLITHRQYCAQERCFGTTSRLLRRGNLKEQRLDLLSRDRDMPPLGLMPTPLLIRSLFMTYVMSSPRLLDIAMPVMDRLATAKAWPLNPDRNPLLKACVKLGFYDYFAGGENSSQVRAKIKRLRDMGYHGAILSFAKETITEQAIEELPSECGKAIHQWKADNLRTLEMLGFDDILAIKYSGAGNLIVKPLLLGEDPPQSFKEALDEILDACLQKGVRVFIDAEQQAFQNTVDQWTIDLMRRYNTPDKWTPNGCLVYTTLQAYLKKAPSRVVELLRLAQTEGWTLGLKLVRGAYLSTERRDAIHDTKEQTDETYDSIVRDILMEDVPGISKENFPSVQIFVATHNEASVLKALALTKKLEASGKLKSKVEYGQLMGMADELGCRLIQETRRVNGGEQAKRKSAPNPLKLTVWGSPQECMQWLVRRAVENRDAIGRAEQWRMEFSNELWRRIKNMGSRGTA